MEDSDRRMAGSKISGKMKRRGSTERIERLLRRKDLQTENLSAPFTSAADGAAEEDVSWEELGW